MKGKVNDGDLVTLKPSVPESLAVGDIVLVRVRGNVYLHLIKAIDKRRRFLIGNNRGGINGWVGSNFIYGIATGVEPR
jgi:SOS-response transcriptional repressor LexA